VDLKRRYGNNLNGRISHHSGFSIGLHVPSYCTPTICVGLRWLHESVQYMYNESERYIIFKEIVLVIIMVPETISPDAAINRSYYMNLHHDDIAIEVETFN